MSKKREPFALLKSLVALMLIVGCLWAAQWQFHRGVNRHHRNAVITSHSTMKPVALHSISDSINSHEWQPVSVDGTFDIKEQILLRNRYSDEGTYGFELLTLFKSTQGQTFWVDCGWVKAGENATSSPEIPEIPKEQVSILGRVRLESSLPTGTFFALPAKSSGQLIAKANAQQHIATSNFYLDLIELPDGTSADKSVPFTPAELPELSDGPHMAYALQWVFFAGLVAYGRYLIRRDVLSSKEL